VKAVRRFLFEPASVAPMAILRMIWGSLIAVWALTLLADVDPFLTDGALRYERRMPPGQWNPLEWTGWTGAPMATCLLLVAAGVATAVGWRTRLSSVVAVLCVLALQRSNPSVFNSGDLLLRQIGIAVALSPAGLVWSLDARRRSRGWSAPVPLRAPWAMRLLQVQLCLGYALSAWAKARGSTWHEGTALALSLRIEDLQRFAPPELLFEQAVTLNVLTWATLAFEAVFGILVWNRVLRPWVLAVGVAFHLGIDLLLDVGFFSYAIIAVYVTWLPASRLEQLVRDAARAAPRRRQGRAGTDPTDPTDPDHPDDPTGTNDTDAAVVGDRSP
jgi:hypothetical protein